MSENENTNATRITITCPACEDSNYTNRIDGSKRCESCGIEWMPWAPELG